MSDDMSFFEEQEIVEKPENFRLIEVKGDEIIVALKMEKPSDANISKSGGKNHVIHFARKTMPFSYKGKAVSVRTMVLVKR